MPKNKENCDENKVVNLKGTISGFLSNPDTKEIVIL